MEEMKQQQRMAIMKDLMKKITSEGRMDAEDRWWILEFLATDCERAWVHPGWRDTMQRWYEWLRYMKKKDEKEKMKEMHQRKVEKFIKSAEESADVGMCVPYPFCTSSYLSLLVVSQMHIDLPDLRAITHPMHPRGSSASA